MEKQRIFEMLRTVMLGHAVADAVGVPAEFKTRGELEISPITDMVGYGTYNLPRGTWSDDTSMSIAALDSLKSGRVDFCEIMENFARWVFDEEYNALGVTFDVGNACLDAIRRYREIKPGDPTVCGGRSDYSNGNGSLMRIHPFAMYVFATNADPVLQIPLIESASALTHGHKRSLIACGTYCFILWELLAEPKRESIYRGIERAREYYKAEKELENFTRLGTNLENIPRDEIKSSGYVVDSIEAALWSILTTKDYKSAVLCAVNLGSDTDTVAAIAGGLAAVLYGFDSIPAEWLRGLKKREYIEEMCHTAAENWGK